LEGVTLDWGYGILEGDLDPTKSDYFPKAQNFAIFVFCPTALLSALWTSEIVVDNKHRTLFCLTVTTAEAVLSL